MTEYKSNSDKSRAAEQNPAPQKKVEKAITGVAKPRKKNGVMRFVDVFAPNDVEDVKTYIFMDVIVPAIKKTIVDVVSDGINMLMYGESGSRSSTGSSIPKVSYQKCYPSSSYKRDRYSNDAHPRQTRLDYEDIVFETRGDAESILSMMKELIERYKVVTVADLYDLADISTDNYMSNKRGWIDLRNAEVVRIRDGYVIKLTKPMVID